MPAFPSLTPLDPFSNGIYQRIRLIFFHSLHLLTLPVSPLIMPLTMDRQSPLILLTAQRPWSYRKYPAFGILFVASALLKAGFRVKIVHPERDRLGAIREAVKEERPLFVGLSVTATPLLLEDIGISKALHAAGVPVVWGGIHPTMVPDTALAPDYVDCILTGEAEDSVVEFAQALAEGRRPEGVPGAGFKADGTPVISPANRFSRDLDRFRPAWELLRLGEYVEIFAGGAERMMAVPLARGCPFACTFCYNQSHPDRRLFRIHGQEWVQEQIAYLQQKAGLTLVRWIADHPFGNVKKGMETISGAGLPWAATGRIDLCDQAFCDWLKESRCSLMGFGFESGSDKALKILQKGFTVEQILTGVINLERAGIAASANWMHLIPGETEADRRETRELMDETFRLSTRLFHDLQGLGPYPSVPIWEKCVAMGLKPPTTNEEWAYSRGMTAPLFGWTETRLQRLITLNRLLYGRSRIVPRIVPDWQYALLRRRFLAGECRGPVEKLLAKRPRLRPFLVDDSVLAH